MSRSASRYSSSLLRSLPPMTSSRSLSASFTLSRMLRSRRMRASRASRSVLPLVPNSISNTARGSFSVGSGVVGVRQEIVLV